MLVTTVTLCLSLCLTTTFGVPFHPTLSSRSNISNYATGPRTNINVFTPTPNFNNPGTLYARTVLLSSGAILASWENYSPDGINVHFPIYESLDGGVTWAQIGQVMDTENGWGMRYEPYFYQLPIAIGAFPVGTILVVGNSVAMPICGTKIDLYASTDGGKTWTFASNVASANAAPGGPGMANLNVWEPAMMTYNNQLLVYYSDQRDPAHYQKISHQSSTDGINWSPVINDAAEADPTLGPGMATVAKMPNGNYIMTYEVRGPDYAIFYRISPDPTTFGSVPEQQLLPQDGTKPASSAVIVWSPVGGPNGTLIVDSYNSQGAIYTNTALGDAGSWVTVKTPQPAAYARQLMVMRDPKYLMICGGGDLAAPGMGDFGRTVPLASPNSVTCSIICLV